MCFHIPPCTRHSSVYVFGLDIWLFITSICQFLPLEAKHAWGGSHRQVNRHTGQRWLSKPMQIGFSLLEWWGLFFSSKQCSFPKKCLPIQFKMSVLLLFQHIFVSESISEHLKFPLEEQDPSPPCILKHLHWALHLSLCKSYMDRTLPNWRPACSNFPPKLYAWHRSVHALLCKVSW